MSQKCPSCHFENFYFDGALWVCLDCSHEWTGNEIIADSKEIVDDLSIKDANGIVLVSGDDVVVFKDLKVKGSSSTVKSGTKVKNIRLDDLGDGHNISCRIEGIGSLHLKSEFVRKG
jgi:protein PhnA